MLNIKQLSERLSISSGTLYNWVSQKKIPHYKPSSRKLLFDEKEIDEWMEKTKIESKNFD